MEIFLKPVSQSEILMTQIMKQGRCGIWNWPTRGFDDSEMCLMRFGKEMDTWRHCNLGIIVADLFVDYLIFWSVGGRTHGTTTELPQGRVMLGVYR